jgi:hypothetical protein
VRDAGASGAAVAGGGAAGGVCENREARLFAAAEDDVEVAQDGLAAGEIKRGTRSNEHLAAGTRGEVELGAVCPTDDHAMQESIRKCLIVAIAVAGVSTIETTVLCLLRYGVLKGNWLLVFYFPVLLGLLLFSAATYLIVRGSGCRRLLLAVGGGVGLTLFWYVVFFLFVAVITGWGGTLMNVNSE